MSYVDKYDIQPGTPEASVSPDDHGPVHYTQAGIEPWEIMEREFTRDQFEAFLRGNVIKYIMRYPRKNGVGDLRKAKHYLEKLIGVYDDK